MASNIHVGLMIVCLLGGCASGNMATYKLCAPGTCVVTDDKNPYSLKVKNIKKHATTKDQIIEMFGEPVRVIDVTQTLLMIGTARYEEWVYKSDDYKSVAIRGALVNGILTIVFVGETVDRVGYKETTSPQDPRVDPLARMRPEEVAAIREKQSKQLVEMLRQINDGEKEIPVGLAQKTLLGDMKGGACNEKFGVEIRIKRAYKLVKQVDIVSHQHFGIKIIGSFKLVSRSNLPKTPVTESPLEGYFDLFGGFLHLASSNAKMEMELARDANGKGWAGVIVGDGFEDCSDITLMSDNGTTTNKLPPISGKLALERSTRLYDLNKFFEKSRDSADPFAEHWMIIAEKQGYTDALYPLGQLYELQGQHSPTKYSHAFQYYRSSAEKTSDIRAQEALGKMYAEGRGTIVNLEEAQRWRSLAANSRKRAAELCTSPKTITAIREIIQKEQNKGKLLGAGIALFTGIQINTGYIRLVKVSAGNVVSLDKPFNCKVEGRRFDPSVDASAVPDFVYGGTDQYGDYFYDNSFDKAGMTIIAGAMDALLKNLPYVDSFRLEPLGGNRYKLSPSATSRQYSATLELH